VTPGGERVVAGGGGAWPDLGEVAVVGKCQGGTCHPLHRCAAFSKLRAAHTRAVASWGACMQPLAFRRSARHATERCKRG
jgi:hypothetical protein